jgi:undecaprenyl-diphosphatase
MNILTLDKSLFLFINGFVGKFFPFDSLIKLVVNEYFVPVTLALILLYLWFVPSKETSKNQKNVLIASISVGLVDLIIELANRLFVRVRPFTELHANLLFYKPTDPSFPSNAATVSFAIATAIFLANKKIGAAALIIAGFYAFSRVYAGVHYPSDVLSGALLGVATTYFISKFDKQLRFIVLKLRKFQRILNLEG